MHLTKERRRNKETLQNLTISKKMEKVETKRLYSILPEERRMWGQSGAGRVK